MKPTPRPWKVVNKPGIPDGGSCFEIRSNVFPREQLAKLYWNNLDAESNAAHIVKCVNEHDHLIERIGWLERIKEYGKRGDYTKMEIEILGYEGHCYHAADPLGAKAAELSKERK